MGCDGGYLGFVRVVGFFVGQDYVYFRGGDVGLYEKLNYFVDGYVGESGYFDQIQCV